MGILGRIQYLLKSKFLKIIMPILPWGQGFNAYLGHVWWPSSQKIPRNLFSCDRGKFKFGCNADFVYPRNAGCQNICLQWILDSQASSTSLFFSARIERQSYIKKKRNTTSHHFLFPNFQFFWDPQWRFEPLIIFKRSKMLGHHKPFIDSSCVLSYL